MKPKSCPVCGTPFTADHLSQKTCSARCGYEYRKASQPFITCKGCGISFRPFPSAIRRAGGKYCTASCYWKYLATKPAFIDVSCTNCGSSFRRTRAAVSRVKSAFCSSRCSNEYISGERHHSYRGGERHRRGPGWDANRRLCRERDRDCRACGKSVSDNGQALSVDHVIPWRLFTDEKVANDLDNLVALCRSCHAKKWRAESAYIRGDVLGWWAYLDNVGIPASTLDKFYPYLRVEGKDAA